ncbi:MAG: carboxypeptidase-like regulatory domain-containing protein, partial [Planctomycetaceae bacterium]
ACDRIAAGDEPTIFAEALFKLGAARSSRISGAIAVKSGSLSDRVKQLLSDAPGSPRWKRIALIAIAVGALLPTAIRVQGVTYAEPKREPVAVDESSPGEWGNQPEFSPEGKAIAVPLNNVVALFDVNTGERVDRDEETSSVEVDADGGGSIVGIVQDSKGNPIANAVLKNAGMSSREVRETTADTEGRFSLANLYRGPRGPEIIVYAPGFISRRLKVVPGPADNPAEIAITMEPGHHIKGRVTDEGGQSLEGVGVSFADGNHPFSIGNRRVTDKEGRFEFDSLSADCPFSFFKAGYSQIENRQLPLDTDDVVAVKMIPSGIILGRVIDRTTGNPIPSFNVRIYYSPTRMPDDPKAALLADWVRPGQSFQSDEGQFQLGDLVAGMPLQLSIDVEGYETAVNERVVAKRSDEVGEGDEVRFELDLIDPATLRKYSGRLVDANGKPVVGAQLRLIVARDRPKLDRTRFPFNWKMIESGQIAEQAKVLRFLRGETDEEGRFEFPPVPRMAEIELAWWGENILAGRSDHLETHDEESTIEIKQDADAKDAREKEKEKAFFDSSNSTPKTPDAEAQVSKEFEIPIDVSGKALDGESQPISAAKIYLTSPRNRGKPLAVTETDKDGLYQFEAVPLPIKRADTNSGQDTGSFEVIGEADGYGFAWRPLKRVYPDVENAVEPNWDTNSVRDLPTRYGLKDKIELDLTFLKASKLSGRIVNDLGEPIGGTAIAIRHCDTEWDREDLNRFGSQYELESINWPELVPPRIKTRRTDADGHFEFDGLPANCRFWIEVRPPGYTPRNIHAVTHDRADVDEAGNRVYSGNFEVDFVRPHKVNIRVVYGDSGEPAPKVGIGGNVSEAGFWETTDENGMVEVPLPDGRYKLSLLPRYGTNYLRTEFELAVSADSVKDIVEIKLRPAAVVDITVLDFETKKPLAGVDVWFADEGSTPQRLNRRVHGYRSWEVETRISHYERPRSDKDGKMRVLFEPGTHQIGVGLNARPSWYVPVEGDGLLIDCKAGETVTAEFHLKNVKKAR